MAREEYSVLVQHPRRRDVRVVGDVFVRRFHGCDRTLGISGLASSCEDTDLGTGMKKLAKPLPVLGTVRLKQLRHDPERHRRIVLYVSGKGSLRVEGPTILR